MQSKEPRRPDWTSIRREFPCTSEGVYLDTATFGPPPVPVQRAVLQCLRDASTGRGVWREWEAAAERARGRFAELAGVGADTVALQPAVSVAAGQVAETLPFRTGANLVVGGGEFRSNLFPWLAQERRGFELRLVPFRGGRLDAGELESAIDGDTACVAFSAVQSSNGFRADVASIARAARARGARVFLDATQSLGALRTPLAGVDYMAVGAYKWLFAPRGAAFLYVAPERIDEMPPLFAGWRSPQDPHAGYYGPPLELARDASRFDVSIAWSVWVGLDAALELALSIGIEAIEERVLGLAARFRAGLAELGLAPAFEGAETSQIVGLSVPDAEAARASLERASVRAAVRGDFLRVSFHFYNDETDVDRALEALREALR